MFTGFDEKNKSKITLQDVDPHALEILVNYVYTSEVDVTEDNVQTLLPAANLMQLSGLLVEFSTQLRVRKRGPKIPHVSVHHLISCLLGNN
jgi:hypothetical protein